MVYKLSDVTAGIGMVGRNVIKTRDGLKTQTRRAEACLKALEVVSDSGTNQIDEKGRICFAFQHWDYEGGYQEFFVTPRYQPGKVYYVKEALVRHIEHGTPYSKYQSDKAAVDHNGVQRLWERDDGTPWKSNVIPAIYMPKSAARTFIEITDVKCERLHDITIADIKAEGVLLPERVPSSDPPPLNVGAENNDQLRQIWRGLWNESNGKKCPWESNSWVFAYEYKTVEVER